MNTVTQTNTHTAAVITTRSRSEAGKEGTRTVMSPPINDTGGLEDKKEKGVGTQSVGN